MSISHTVYSSESPLRHPARFVTAAVRDLLAARPFAGRLFRQLLAQRYRYSTLGFLWAFAPPIITTLLLALSRRNMPSAEALPPALYAVFGLMLAQTLLETFYSQRTVFTSNRVLISRHRGTVEAIVLANLYDNLVGLGIKAAIVAGFMIACHAVPASTLPLGLLGLAVIFLIGSGLGLCFAPLSALKSDVDKILTFVPFLIFGLTPVFAPVDVNSQMSRLYEDNPFTWLFDNIRAFTFGHAHGNRQDVQLDCHGELSTLIAFSIISLCMFPAALLFCRIARPHVVERQLD